MKAWTYDTPYTCSLLQINNSMQLLTIQVKEKIHHTMINIIFNTYQSFTYLHIIISNYPQKIGKIFGLKDRFRQVRLSFYNFNTIKTIEPKSSKQTLVPQLCIHLDQIWVQLSIHVRFTGQLRQNHQNHKVRLSLSLFQKNSIFKAKQVKTQWNQSQPFLEII